VSTTSRDDANPLYAFVQAVRRVMDNWTPENVEALIRTLTKREDSLEKVRLLQVVELLTSRVRDELVKLSGHGLESSRANSLVTRAHSHSHHAWLHLYGERTPMPSADDQWGLLRELVDDAELMGILGLQVGWNPDYKQIDPSLEFIDDAKVWELWGLEDRTLISRLVGPNINQSLSSALEAIFQACTETIEAHPEAAAGSYLRRGRVSLARNNRGAALDDFYDARQAAEQFRDLRVMYEAHAEYLMLQPVRPASMEMALALAIESFLSVTLPDRTKLHRFGDSIDRWIFLCRDPFNVDVRRIARWVRSHPKACEALEVFYSQAEILGNLNPMPQVREILGLATPPGADSSRTVF